MTSTVSVRIKGLFESGLFTDVSFLVGDNELQESLSAHRCILGGASPIFERMFGGNFRESNMKDMKILVLDVLPSAFKTMLKWIYTDEADLSLDNVAPVLYCAEKYQLSTLKYECISFIMKNFEIENLCQLFYQTRLHHVSELIPNMKICIGMNASRSLSSDSFLNIKHNEVLKDILSLDELDLDEIEVFKAALRWLSARKKEDNNVKKSMREIIGSALYSIRFPLLTADQFVNNVMPSGLLKDQEVLETLGLISKSKSTVPITLSIKPRIRHCYRFESTVIGPLSSKLHSIEFSVNKSVKIYGFGIYRPTKSGNVLAGIIRLESFNSTEQENLCTSSFSLRSDGSYTISRVNFDQPIPIFPESHYKVILEFDPSSSLDMECYSGFEGKTELIVDDVEFSFKEYSDSRYTSVKKGQIPWIHFSRI